MEKRKRIVLVAGSSRGLGAHLASTLGAEGLKVVTHGQTAGMQPFDVGEAQAVHDGVKTIEREVGPIDVLINCASQCDIESIDALSPQRWHDVLQATLSGAFHLSQAIIPKMQARGAGRVIHFGCVGCDRVYHGTHSVAYRVAASGVLSLTRAYAQLVAKSGVTVNCIAPGFLENHTGAIEPSALPLGRLSTFAEIVPTVRYLLSDEAAHVNGAVIAVSGGYVR
jgi:acetoacetyl-CoA reductase